MNKIKGFVKKNYKVVIGIIIGITISIGIGVSAVATKDITYDNSKSGLTSTNLQGAIDEVYKKTDIRNYDNIVSAYTYNSSTCVTGEEETCVKTTCYKSTTAGSCPAGTIIKYKVNDTDIVTFHVMYDNGTTMTMQSQKNTVNNTMWISAADYATENTDSTSCSNTSCNDEGPMTVLVALERATRGWTNVNDQTYTMGTTVFKDNAFTGCYYNSCTTNTYTLDARTAKARMITTQEITNLGCTDAAKSCPNWMNNYLYNSTSYGGTVSDSSTDPTTGSPNYGYWTMSAYSSSKNHAWYVYYNGNVRSNGTYRTYYGARAVVVVSK